MYVRGMQEGEDTVVRSVEEGGRLIWLADRSLKVVPLPVLVAVNGHAAFLQHLPERYSPMSGQECLHEVHLQHILSCLASSLSCTYLH